MKPLFFWKTKVGKFYICRSSDGRFHPVFNNESLGSYASASQAAEDLALNATFSVLHPISHELLDTSELGIPVDVADWEKY